MIAPAREPTHQIGPAFAVPDSIFVLAQCAGHSQATLFCQSELHGSPSFAATPRTFSETAVHYLKYSA